MIATALESKVIELECRSLVRRLFDDESGRVMYRNGRSSPKERVQFIGVGGHRVQLDDATVDDTKDVDDAKHA